MIARVWRGVVHSDKLEEYVDIVEETGHGGVPAYARQPRRPDPDPRPGEGRAEIITISWWPDVDHVRGFAGEDIEVAKYYPSDDPYLIDRDDTVVHYNVASD
jgi:hypothetical protein